MKQEQKALTLKTLSKSNIWDAQENDSYIFLIRCKCKNLLLK